MSKNTRYQICPKCKKLIEEGISECPYCHKDFTGKEKRQQELWWCNYCEIYVNPLNPMLPGPGEFNLLESIIVGQPYTEYFLVRQGNHKVKNNPRGLICPKCRGINLRKEGPYPANRKVDQDLLLVLKMRLAKGEITLKEYEELKKALL